jgi:hypothetical protein
MSDVIRERLFRNATRLPNGCLIFGGRHSCGKYGAIQIKGKNHGAHRLSYELNVGPIPDGLWVLHKCDTPKCIEPTHLFIGNVKDNVRDAMVKGRLRPFFGHRYTVQHQGERNPACKLNVFKVKEIRTALNAGESQEAIAQRYGVSQTNVSAIRRRVIWADA